MYCEQRDRNGSTILECFGHFDEDDTNQFLQTLEQLQSQGKRTIIFNLTPMYFLDPKVVNLFAFAQDFFTSHGGSICLVTPLSSVRNELIRARVPDSIPTYETLYDAFHRPHSALTKSDLSLPALEQALT